MPSANLPGLTTSSSVPVKSIQHRLLPLRHDTDCGGSLRVERYVSRSRPRAAPRSPEPCLRRDRRRPEALPAFSATRTIRRQAAQRTRTKPQRRGWSRRRCPATPSLRLPRARAKPTIGTGEPSRPLRAGPRCSRRQPGQVAHHRCARHLEQRGPRSPALRRSVGWRSASIGPSDEPSICHRTRPGSGRPRRRQEIPRSR